MSTARIERSRDAWRDIAQCAEAERDAALADLEAWHAECDKVHVPHEPEGLVRHHRRNADFAADNYRAALDGWRERAERAEADLEAATALLRRVKADRPPAHSEAVWLDLCAFLDTRGAVQP